MTVHVSLDLGGTAARGVALRWPDGPAVPLEAPSRNLRLILDLELGRLLLTIRDQLVAAGLTGPAWWLIGAAGGRPASDAPRLAQLLADLAIPAAGLHLWRDFEANHAAAFAGGDGILTVNGTGSVLYGRWQGAEARRGGWGYLLDEVPSAGACGRWALQAILQAQAGNPVSLVWPSLVASSLPPEAATTPTLLDHLYATSSPQKVLGSFAPFLTTAADQGCPWARARLEASFDQWAAEMGRLADELAIPAPVPFAGIGGLWQHWPGCRPLASKALHHRFPGRFTGPPARLDPAWGPLVRHLAETSPAHADDLATVVQLADQTTIPR